MGFPDIRIIDAHVHQWDPFRTPREFGPLAKLYRRLPVPIDIGFRLAPRRDRQFIGDPTAYLHPYLPEDYRRDIAEVPVDTLVHIEVEWSARDPLAKADETAWVARLPFDGRPELGAIVAGAHPAAPRFAEVLDAHLAASPLVCGIRTMVAHHPDPAVRSFTRVESELTTKEFLTGFGALAERAMSFEAWVYSHALPDVSALAQRYPEVPIVLNHLGTPAGVFGPVGKRTGTDPSQRRKLFARWRDDLSELATHANVVAKVSGLTMPILGHPVPPRGTSTPVATLLDRLAPMIEHAVEVFGAGRLLWGSNYPVDKPITSIANSMRTIADAVTGCGGSASDLEQIFRRTAARVYRISSAR